MSFILPSTPRPPKSIVELIVSAPEPVVRVNATLPLVLPYGTAVAAGSRESRPILRLPVAAEPSIVVNLP